MKTTLTILLLLLGISPVYSTGQYPDYLIQGQDTVPIFNNPLEQYFEKVGNRELIDFENPCWSTACWRGYKAYWELKTDSLFLVKVTSCHDDCNESKDANLLAMFGKKRPFASWYNGTLTVPKGELFSGSDMGYNAIFEFEDKLQIENGLLKSKQQISNIELIEQIKLDNKLYAQIPTLKDTLFNTHWSGTKLISSSINDAEFEGYFYETEIITPDSTYTMLFPEPDSQGKFNIAYSIYVKDSSIHLGVDEEYILSKDDLLVYPNPSNNVINIRSENAIISSIEVYDISGKLIKSQNYKSKEALIDISNFSNGIYFLSIERGENRVSRKVIKY